MKEIHTSLIRRFNLNSALREFSDIPLIFFLKWKLLESDVRQNLNVEKCWASFRNVWKLVGIVVIKQTGKQYWHTSEQLPWNEILLSMGTCQLVKKVFLLSDLFWAKAFYYFYTSNDGNFIFIVAACIQYF